jgi:RND superfamily putative drug exporter
MFAGIARSVIAHPWRPIVFWPVGGLMIALSPSLSTYTSSDQQPFVPNSFESVKSQNVGNRHFPAQSGATRSLVISRNDAGKLTSDDQQKVKGLVSTVNSDKLYSNGKVMVGL